VTRALLSLATFLVFVCGVAAASERTVTEGHSIQEVVNAAAAGDLIKVMPGLYHETVYVDKDHVYLMGVIQEGRWPVLDGEDVLNDGILIAGHGVTVEHFHVKRYRGNGIMGQGGNNFRFLSNWVEGGKESVYGIFPQFGKNGLVAWNIVSGVQDAAIYVGMCEHVDVTANDTSESVIGIESENSHHVLIEGNYVHGNSTGITLTLIPGLPVKTASDTIVRNNFIVNNNSPSRAPPGSIAADVPTGTGILVFAADAGTFEGNVIRGHDNVGILFADQSLIPAPPDPKEDPLPDNNRVLDNVFIENGNQPGGIIGDLLTAAGRSKGVDLMSTGKGRNNCILGPGALSRVGVDSWTPCAPGATSSLVRTEQLSQPVRSQTFTLAQKGRLTYVAVCTGCHSYSTRVIGPPMLTIQALYKGREHDLARWIAAPTRKRPDYPEMPPQNYLPEDVRLAVANYILNDLRP